MKYVHTFGTDRHNRQADVTLLFQYIFKTWYHLLAANLVSFIPVNLVSFVSSNLVSSIPAHLVSFISSNLVAFISLNLVSFTQLQTLSFIIFKLGIIFTCTFGII